jgi:hypothetical protein
VDITDSGQCRATNCPAPRNSGTVQCVICVPRTGDNAAGGCDNKGGPSRNVSLGSIRVLLLGVVGNVRR